MSKLRLNKERLRRLDPAELARIAAGTQVIVACDPTALTLCRVCPWWVKP